MKYSENPSSASSSNKTNIIVDHTSYQLYADSPINPTGGADKMSFNEIYRYMGEHMETVFHAVQDPDSDKVTYETRDRGNKLNQYHLKGAEYGTVN